MITLDSPTAPAQARSTAAFWKAAGVTAFAALLFPRLQAVIHNDQRIWELDPEAQVLAPLVVVTALAIFAVIGRPLWRGRGTMPATASLVIGILAVVGILAFWISAPIMLGGLAATLGYEGIRRGDHDAGRGRAITGLVLGALAAVGGATMWLAGV
jgi:hypothetical protein